MSYCIFANFKIDSSERLQRMKDSFDSFKSSSISELVINVRGEFKDEAILFLNTQFSGRKSLTKFESSQGWFYDSRNMFQNIQCETIFFWIEDHICQKSPEVINSLVTEIEKSGIDYVEYSWHSNRILNNLIEFHGAQESEQILYFDLNSKSNEFKNECYYREIARYPYLISCAAYFSKSFFSKVLFKNHPLIPRWTIFAPFDFEKRWDDLSFLPFKIGYLKEELFAAIDDDNMFKGSSLISRGLYPERITRNQISLLTSGNSHSDDKTSTYLELTKFKFHTMLKRFGFLMEKFAGYFSNKDN